MFDINNQELFLDYPNDQEKQFLRAYKSKLHKTGDKNGMVKKKAFKSDLHN